MLYQPYTFQDDSLPGRSRAPTPGASACRSRCRSSTGTRGTSGGPGSTSPRPGPSSRPWSSRSIFEVRQAERHYAVTRTAVGRIERSLLPKARLEHDRVTPLYFAGKADELTFLTAEHDFDQVVRQYRDTLVRHRRAMLRLNTAVGVRILP